MKREISKVIKTHLAYEAACAKLEEKIKSVCDFDAYLTWCAGDGHLIGNGDTASVAMMGCIHGKTENNKLTAEEHLEYCI